MYKFLFLFTLKILFLYTLCEISIAIVEARVIKTGYSIFYLEE